MAISSMHMSRQGSVEIAISDTLQDGSFENSSVDKGTLSVNNAAAIYNHMKDYLIQNNMDARILDMYHRSIDEDSAQRILDQFRHKDSQIRCIISTVAFGLGIQIPDIKVVVHWGLTKTPLTYWQEIGRAGRDGADSLAICYAYSRSMMRSQTDEGFIQATHDILHEGYCVRIKILSTLEIKNGPAARQVNKTCAGDCTTVCNCECCLCCTNCFDKCKCRLKRNKFGENVLEI